VGFFLLITASSKEVLELIRSRRKIGRKEVLNLLKIWQMTFLGGYIARQILMEKLEKEE
jgi:hypothetical protein